MKFFTSRCYEGGARHHFEARYSVDSAPTVMPKQMAYPYTGEGEARVLDASRKTASKYEGDVCTWCGKVVNERPAS